MAGFEYNLSVRDVSLPRLSNSFKKSMAASGWWWGAVSFYLYRLKTSPPPPQKKKNACLTSCLREKQSDHLAGVMLYPSVKTCYPHLYKENIPLLLLIINCNPCNMLQKPGAIIDQCTSFFPLKLLFDVTYFTPYQEKICLFAHSRSGCPLFLPIVGYFYL